MSDKRFDLQKLADVRDQIDAALMTKRMMTGHGEADLKVSAPLSPQAIDALARARVAVVDALAHLHEAEARLR